MMCRASSQVNWFWKRVCSSGLVEVRIFWLWERISRWSCFIAGRIRLWVSGVETASLKVRSWGVMFPQKRGLSFFNAIGCGLRRVGRRVVRMRSMLRLECFSMGHPCRVHK